VTVFFINVFAELSAIEVQTIAAKLFDPLQENFLMELRPFDVPTHTLPFLFRVVIAGAVASLAGSSRAR
jgi:hypothetical protein